MKKNTLLFVVVMFDFLFSQVNIDSGLVVYMPFNGNTRDYSGRNNHGFAYGITWHPNRFKEPDHSAYLTDDKSIIIPFTSDFDFASTMSFSVGYWANSNAIGFSNFSSEFECLSCFQFAMYPDASKPPKILVTIMGSHCWIFIRSGNTDLTGWHHYFVTLNDKQIHLYIDGKIIATQAAYNLRWRMASLHNLGIGLTPGKTCSIDEFRMYNRKLTTEEVDYLFNLKK